jgi:ornithine--oxo-acid transaminase
MHGKRYLDCLAAYSAVNQGHCHPKILRKAPAKRPTLQRYPSQYHSFRPTIGHHQGASGMGR